MKVMVVGAGGREHVLAWKISQSDKVSDLICVPGNAGMAQMARCIQCGPEDIPGLVSIAKKERVDLTVVGPEAPLVVGIRESFDREGLALCGPSREAAQIEGSKYFAKSLMKKYGIPTGDARVFDDYQEASTYVQTLDPPMVVKADGLAAGKGVFVAPDQETALAALRTCLVEKKFGSSGERVLVEEYLEGEEVSILAFCSGAEVSPMVPSQDYKRIFDRDEGPNTGGMGAYSPVPAVSADLERTIVTDMMERTAVGLEDEKIPYTGILYGGLILTDRGPKVLEFNVRFGDPESQAVLPRMDDDLLEGIWATVEGRVADLDIKWSPEVCVCVVVASGGYPGKYQKGIPILGLEAAAADPNVLVFHAGTRLDDGKVVTSGGRVLGVVAKASDFEEARGIVYEAVERIQFEGMQYRKDIGLRAVGK